MGIVDPDLPINRQIYAGRGKIGDSSDLSFGTGK
jgi:hypothetical protein